MTQYTSMNPVFSRSIPIVEVTDPAHADNVNASPKQLLQNDLVLMSFIDPSGIDVAFYSVFTHLKKDESENLSPIDIIDALSTEWHGESSPDPTALNSMQVEDAINTGWHGESSDDPTALDADEVEESIAMGEELAGY